jgi:1-acyl-sn-glycerol-3-phosphate acyltransferase
MDPSELEAPMEWVPPRLARRLIVDPLVVLISLVALGVALPVLLATAIVDLIVRRPFPTTRLAAVALTHAVFEGLAVVCLTGLWLGCLPIRGVRGARGQELHHRFIHWWLSSLMGITGRLVGIRVLIQDRQPPRNGPVLVFSRHAGPWDSFLLAHTLGEEYHRHARVVMKAAMQWSPAVDLIGNRLPNRFIRRGGPRGKHAIEAIEELAGNLGDHDALVLFPEGGNFTERRRLAAIQRLIDDGHLDQVGEAVRLTNLIAPRPAGVMAAMRSAPGADVVFVAHTGLEPLTSLAELWRRVPLRSPLIGRYWRLPPGDVPSSAPERIDWLYEWWERIDTWIDEQRLAGSGIGGVG